MEMISVSDKFKAPIDLFKRISQPAYIYGNDGQEDEKHH